MRYLVVIHKDEHSDFGLSIPDVSGCYSLGSTYDEVLTNAMEEIKCHLEGLLIDKESVPVGTTIDH